MLKVQIQIQAMVRKKTMTVIWSFFHYFNNISEYVKTTKVSVKIFVNTGFEVSHGQGQINSQGHSHV